MVTSDHFEHGFNYAKNGFDPEGPLLVYFDRAFLSATSMHFQTRLESDPKEAGDVADFPVDEIPILPEKMDMEVHRKQQTLNMDFDLVQI